MLAEAVRIGNKRNKDDPKKILLLLRYTGMHSSVLANPNKYNLHVEDRNIVWNRTKKKGKEAHTDVRISKHIDFDIQEFIDDWKQRKRKRTRFYIHSLVRRIGDEAGIKGVSPMSLRHTFGVSLLDLDTSVPFVQQKLNCTPKMLETYLKYSKKRSDDQWDKLKDW